MFMGGERMAAALSGENDAVLESLLNFSLRGFASLMLVIIESAREWNELSWWEWENGRMVLDFVI
jgi:hypothetical protein